MKVIASHYQGDCTWIPEYTDDYFIYDRSFDGCGLDTTKVKKTRNIGNVDYDRLTYIIENYEILPEVFILTKSNLFQFITEEEFEEVKDNTTLTPLLTQNHEEKMCHWDKSKRFSYYEDGMYYELNNSWFLGTVPAKYFSCFEEFARTFFFDSPEYIPFAPGGNYIVTREAIHKHSKQFYQRMRIFLPYSILPGEAQIIERSYYLLWS